MARHLPILAAIAVVLAVGTVQGVWTGRWITSTAVKDAAARLEQVPLSVGDWEGEPQEFDTKDYERAGIVGGLLRRYVNRRTGAAVSVLMVCGRPGPISVHTPDICYRGAGYSPLAEQDRATVDLAAGARPGEFWWLRMRKQNTIIPEYLGIHYAWSATGDWKAPKQDPRFEFAQDPFLYKLYVVRDLATPEGQSEAEEDLGFLREFIPALRRSLFPDASAPAAPTASTAHHAGTGPGAARS